MNLSFYVKGPEGVVQFVIYSGWYPEIIAKPDTDWMTLSMVNKVGVSPPMAADLGYHSPTPRYEDHAPIKECEWMGGASCYYDGSSLNGNKLLSLMIHEGGEAMWKELEDYYASVFTPVKQ